LPSIVTINFPAQRLGYALLYSTKMFILILLTRTDIHISQPMITIRNTFRRLLPWWNLVDMHFLPPHKLHLLKRPTFIRSTTTTVIYLIMTSTTVFEFFRPYHFVLLPLLLVWD
jgi:hypothetical protein